MTTFALRALLDRIIVDPIEKPKTTESGLRLIEKNNKPAKGIVLAAGPGTIDKNGTPVRMEISVGNTVIFPKGSGIELEFEDKKYLVLRQEDIVAVHS